MGIYRVLDLSDSRTSTILINQIENDIKLISQISIGDVVRSDLVYDIVQFKKHLNCDITKCPVGLSIIESATLALCTDLVATHNNVFEGHARKLLLTIIDELGAYSYEGILKQYYNKLRNEN